MHTLESISLQVNDLLPCFTAADANDAVSAEPYIDWDYQLQILKVGEQVAAFRRTRTEQERVSGLWKGGEGPVVVEQLTAQMQDWVDEVAQVFGGLEIFSLEILHSGEDGAYHILRIRDTATPLWMNVDEAHSAMGRVVVDRLAAIAAAKVLGGSDAFRNSVDDQIGKLNKQIKNLKKDSRRGSDK